MRRRLFKRLRARVKLEKTANKIENNVDNEYNGRYKIKLNELSVRAVSCLIYGRLFDKPDWLKFREKGYCIIDASKLKEISKIRGCGKKTKNEIYANLRKYY